MPLVHCIGQRLAGLHTIFVNVYSHITSPFVRHDHEDCGVLRSTVHSTGTNPYFVFEASVIDVLMLERSDADLSRLAHLRHAPTLQVAASAVPCLLRQLNSRTPRTVL